MLSAKFVSAFNTATMPKYKIARAAGVHPITIWKLINNYQVVHDGDARLVRVGALLGLKPEEIFEESAHE